MDLDDEIPLGLQQLTCLDELSVTSMTNHTSINKYTFMNPDRTTVVLYAEEEPTEVLDLLVGRSRDLRFRVFDSQQQVVFTLDRDYSIGPSKMEIGFGGQLASIVRRKCTMKHNCSINNAYDQPVLHVEGPRSIFGKNFFLYNNNKEQVGVIRRRRDHYKYNEFYNLKFPRDLDVRIKAALVGLCILMDVMIYEGSCC